MTSNVLPSAPPDKQGLYPQLPQQHDFRMQKANEVSAALNAEVMNYRAVAKKYKRAKKTTSELWFCFDCCWHSCCNSAGRRWWFIRSCFLRADNRQQKARFEDKETSRDCNSRNRQARHGLQAPFQSPL